MWLGSFFSLKDSQDTRRNPLILDHLILQHTDRGMVSMANNGPNANASQFFITYAAQPNLDLKYTLFGRVIDGFDALDELEKLPVNPKNYRPHVDKKINGVTIHANPLAT